MKKPFNIHDWQAKQTIKRLTEQGDIDNIMRMNPDANDMTIKGEKRSVVDYDNRDDRTTELFLDNGDSVEVDVIELYDNLKENNPDLEEASMTGTGASFTAGSGAGYMTPNAFKKKKEN
tara:strand:+ start:292 stop:648 length:357 start_codon:yes stop_codon:yes gene_type:complete